jgi:hypothetical protein
VPARLYDVVQLDDRGVPDQLQDVDLPGHSLHIRHIDDLLLY